MTRAAGVALLAATLAAAACGGAGEPRTPTQPRAEPPPPRVPVRIVAPGAGRAIAARPLGGRLRAVVVVSGSAAAGQQLVVVADCGALDCQRLAFADSAGRWRARVALSLPAGRRGLRLRAAYADAGPGEPGATRALRLAPVAPRLPAASRTRAPAVASAPLAGPRTLVVIGDSLAVGMADALRAALPGWDVAIDARTGRPLAEGMGVLAATRLPAGARGARAILAFSLFTNDDPRAVAALEAAVRASVARLGPHGCALWATIARPPLFGVSYDAANARLRALATDPALAGRLLLVPWHEAVARHPSWLAADAVHGTPEGYVERARLYAQAARSCAA